MTATDPSSGVLVSIIVAVGSNNVIGVAGGLPWRLRADLRKFRAITMGKPLIMGRKTFESIGRVLDGRDIVVVTRHSDFSPAGVFIATTATRVIRNACELVRSIPSGSPST